MRFIKTISLVLALISPVMASAADGVFKDYSSLRAQLDSLMKAREVDQLLILFGGSDEMTPQQLSALKGRVQQIYRRDFENVQVIRRQELANGWRQELISYFTGLDYIYVYMLLHDRGDALVSINFKFNSDFDEMNQYF